MYVQTEQVPTVSAVWTLQLPWPAHCAWQGCCFNAASFCAILHPVFLLLLLFLFAPSSLKADVRLLFLNITFKVKKLQFPVQSLLKTLSPPLHPDPPPNYTSNQKELYKSSKNALTAWGFQIRVHSSAVGVQENSCLPLHEGALRLLDLSLYQESQTVKDYDSCSASSTACSFSVRLRGWRGLSSLLHHLLGSAKSLNLNQFQREGGQNFRGDLNSS